MISDASSLVPPFMLKTWRRSPTLRSSILIILSPSLITVFEETITLYSIGIGADGPRPAAGAEPPPPPRRPPRPPPRTPPPPPVRPPDAAPSAPVVPSLAMLYDVAYWRSMDLFFTSTLLTSPIVRNFDSV